MKEILVVEDDRTVSGGLCWHLQRAGYAPFPVYSEKEALEAYSRKEYALLLLDVNLPDGSGFYLARKLKEKRDTPVIFLTGCDQDEEMLEGFEAGADDYVTKPFNVKLLLKRAEAVLRRSGREPGGRVLDFGALEVDLDGHQVSLNGERVELTPTEFELLSLLCQNPGVVLTRRVLLERLWDSRGNFVDEHALTVQMSRLKAKLKDGDISYIRTVYGTGYQWTGGTGD